MEISKEMLHNLALLVFARYNRDPLGQQYRLQLRLCEKWGLTKTQLEAAVVLMRARLHVELGPGDPTEPLLGFKPQGGNSPRDIHFAHADNLRRAELYDGLSESDPALYQFCLSLDKATGLWDPTARNRWDHWTAHMQARREEWHPKAKNSPWVTGRYIESLEE